MSYLYVKWNSFVLGSARRPSQFSRPAFFYRSFFWALLQANSCVRQLRGFCFPGSALTPPLGSLPECSRSLWKQQPSLFGAPGKWGKKKEIQNMSYLYVKWNSFGLRFARRRFRH